VTTTWRDVIDAAMTVGRDPAPWLSALPALARSELVAQWSPLVAYLRRIPVARGRSEYAVEPNAVYREGAEKTAQAAFGYRIGMTMAEWACRGLMGLGPTLHAEAGRPDGAAAWHAASGLPDLIGEHWRPPAAWLIEAKGARRPGLPVLRKGAMQVSKPGLMSGPHVRVLCGTSLEHRVFMIIDVEVLAASATPPPGRPRPRPESDDSQLLALARSRMLTYYTLTSLPAGSVSVRPVGPAIADLAARDDGTGLVYPLEQDDSTSSERLLARDPAAWASQRSPAQRLDMLTGSVPGTGISIGMSRRLFGACRNLAAEDREAWSALSALPARRGMNDRLVPFDAEDDAVDELILQRREYLTDWEEDTRPRQLTSAREGFDRGSTASWTELLNTQPPLDTDTHPSLLESATEDAYLAIQVQQESGQ
jgi:hypothetical protein